MKNPPKSIIDFKSNGRFWSKIYSRVKDQCWNWIRACNSAGYGHYKISGKMQQAHRVAYFLAYNKWSKNCILHSCDNRRCCNPEHLFEGTRMDNIQDMVSKGRQAKGVSKNNVKLIEKQVIDIRLLKRFGAKLNEICQLFQSY